MRGVAKTKHLDVELEIIDEVRHVAADLPQRDSSRWGPVSKCLAAVLPTRHDSPCAIQL